MKETMIAIVMKYGYAALYGLLASGMIGLPVPDETLMAFAGSLTHFGAMAFLPAWLSAFAGTMTGMTVSYWIGRRAGKPLLEKYGRWLFLTPRRLAKAEGWFQRYGYWTISVGYFIPGIRHFTCYLSGISQIPYPKYALYAGGGAFVWSLSFLALGRLLGSNLATLLPLVHRYVGWTLGLAAIAACLLAALWMWRRARRAEP